VARDLILSRQSSNNIKEFQNNIGFILCIVNNFVIRRLLHYIRNDKISYFCIKLTPLEMPALRHGQAITILPHFLLLAEGFCVIVREISEIPNKK